MADELMAYDGLGLAALVQQGEVTPAELVEMVIGRIERVNPQLNAVVTTLYDQAQQTAVGNLPDGPFTGVPFLLKDLSVMAAGVRYTAGSAVFSEFVPQIDSELVTRYRKAGLIFIGKTNTPEFGLLPTTESTFLGTCRNPWHLDYSTGGSSGGAAAAVAAGIVPVAHASDGGGSIRIPASCCGIFGLKPTRARTPVGPLFGDVMSGLSISHCVSRTVRDSAALLDATAGPMAGDPYWAPPQERPFLTEVTTNPGPLRIGLVLGLPDGPPVHPDCVAAIQATAQLCTSLGHQVKEMQLAIDRERFTREFVTVWAAGVSWTINSIAQNSGIPAAAGAYEPTTWGLYELGQQYTASDYLLAIQYLQSVGRQMSGYLAQFDVLLTPVLAEPPLPLGPFLPTADNPMAGFERAISYVPFTPIANATGLPAMSVPLYWNEAGLPVGSHFIGRFGDEATLFRLAGQLEQAQPWAGKKAAVSIGAEDTGMLG